MFKHSLDYLDNGLPVLRVPMPAMESVSVLLLSNTGSRYEKPEQYGIAHFLEHMVFKGTKKYPDAQSLAEVVDGVGADFNAFTGKEYTGYYVKAASRHLELALDVVSEMLMMPRLRQADIDREKGVILEEINMYRDTPARHIGNLFEQMTYQGTGLEHDIIGLPETVTALKTADFKSFLQEWYGLPNMLLIVAGDERVVGDQAVRSAKGGARRSTTSLLTKTTSLLTKIELAFNKGQQERIQEKVAVRTQLEDQPYGTNRLHVEHKPTEQAHLVLGWPGLSRHDQQRHALSLLGIILGGNMSSRLFSEVREKRGLAYYVSTDIDLYHSRGNFGASAGVDTKRIEEAVTVILAEFNQLAAGKKPITQQELDRAKEYTAGKMALAYEDSLSVAQFYGMKQLLTDQIESPDEVLAKVRAVELEEVQQLVQQLVQPEEVRLALIGPYEDQEKFAKLI